jgi:flagellar biosynthesis protein FlhB
MADAWNEFLSSLSVLFSQATSGIELEQLKAVLKAASLLFIAPAIALFVVFFVMVFAQTRGLFLPHRIAPDIARLNPLQSVSIGALLRRIPQSLGVFSLQIGAAAAVAYLLMPAAFQGFLRTKEFILQWPGEMYRNVLPFLILVLVVVLGLGLVGERYRFRYQHRMSRKEVEDESRTR